MKNNISKFSILCATIIVVCMSIFVSYNSIAAEGDEPSSLAGTIMTVTKDTIARSQPDEGADVVVVFSKGENIFVVDEKNGWYEIFYQGETAYVKSASYVPNDAGAENSSSVSAVAETSINEGLVEEFKQKEQFDVTYVDSFEKQQRRNRNALVWKIIIGVLVVAIIAVSIIVGIKNSKKSQDGESDKK